MTFSGLYENASAIIPVVFDSPTSQDVMTLGRPSPKLAEVSVEVRVNGALRILKKDAQSKEMIEIARRAVRRLSGIRWSAGRSDRDR